MKQFLPAHFDLLDKHFIYSLEHTHKLKINQNMFKSNQVGGGIRYKTFTYMDKHFNFKIDDDDVNDIRIAIITLDESECVTVFVQKQHKLALLHNMFYDDKCAKEGLKKPGGDILIRLMLSYLIKKRKKYHIDRITLVDQSYLFCGPKSDITIKLARLRMITHGEPWYVKYGFKPYKPDKNEPDVEALQWISYNNKILEDLQTSSVNVIKIANNVKDVDISDIKRLISKYSLFKNFIKRLTNQLNKYCPLLEAILEDVYKATPLHTQLLYDYYKTHFYLDIYNL